MKTTRFAIAMLAALAMTAGFVTNATTRAAAAGEAAQSYEFSTSDIVQLRVNGTNSGNETYAREFLLNINGQRIKGYCADVGVSVPSGQLPYNFDAAKTASYGQARSVVANGYPNLSLQELESKFGVSGLTEAAAISATQAAVWRFTNDLPRLSFSSTRAWTRGSEGAAQSLYQKMIEQASSASIPNWASAQIKVNTSQATYANGRVGPITVTGAHLDTVTVKSVAGGTLVYSDGSAVGTTIDTKRPVYIATSNSSGSASLTVTGNAYVAPGVVISAPGSQDIITSQPFGISSEATGQATWTSPQPPADKLPTPKVSTMVSQQVAAPGATISDTMVVSGTVTSINGNKVTNIVDGTLWGPVPARRDATGSLTCEGLDWTQAPKAVTWTVPVTNQTYTNQGTYKIPDSAQSGQCYTYSEKLTATEDKPGGQTETYNHVPGQTAQTFVVEVRTPNPSVTTKASAQIAAPGTSISDTVVVSGANAYKSANNAKVDAVGQLWGPMPAVNGTCAAVDWTNAPKAGNEFVLADVSDGSYPNSGTFTIPSSSNGNECYTYSEKLFAYPANGTPNRTNQVYDHPKGDSAQTTVVAKPETTPTPVVTTSVSAQTVKEGMTISDTVTVTGVDAYNKSKNTSADVVATLYGPMPSVGGSCNGIDWSTAAKQDFTVKNVKDGATPDVGLYKIQTGMGGMCFTYAEKLFVYPTGSQPNTSTDTPVYTHKPGEVAQTTLVTKPTPMPKVSTIASSNVALPGAEITDTVTVTGANAYNAANGTKTDVVGTLYGPVKAVKDAAGNYSCMGLDWTSAPTALTWTIPAAADGIYTNQGTYKIPAATPKDSCYTYAEKLIGYPSSGTPDKNSPPLYNHKPGIDSQTVLVGEKAPALVSTTVTQRLINPGEDITDTVRIAGVDEMNRVNGTVADVTVSLWGPADAVNGSCNNVNWASFTKPVAVVTLSKVKDGTMADVAPYRVPMGTENQCYTYSEQLVVYKAGESPSTGTVKYDHPRGIETQTKVISAPMTPTSNPSVSTVVSAQVVKPGDTISDTVQVSGIKDSNANYVVTGNLYGPLPAKLGVPQDKMCEGLDWTKAAVIDSTKFEFAVTRDGDYSGYGKFQIPKSTSEFVCYTYGEKLTMTKGNQLIDSDTHVPGVKVQTALVYDTKFLDRGASLQPEKNYRPLGDTGRR